MTPGLRRPPSLSTKGQFPSVSLGQATWSSFLGQGPEHWLYCLLGGYHAPDPAHTLFGKHPDKEPCAGNSEGPAPGGHLGKKGAVPSFACPSCLDRTPRAPAAPRQPGGARRTEHRGAGPHGSRGARLAGRRGGRGTRPALLRELRGPPIGLSLPTPTAPPTVSGAGSAGRGPAPGGLLGCCDYETVMTVICRSGLSRAGSYKCSLPGAAASQLRGFAVRVPSHPGVGGRLRVHLPRVRASERGRPGGGPRLVQVGAGRWQLVHEAPSAPPGVTAFPGAGSTRWGPLSSRAGRVSRTPGPSEVTRHQGHRQGCRQRTGQTTRCPPCGLTASR